MLIYAHRGDHRRAPENTIDAFNLAQACGADGIETDLRHTRDGIVVLYHDHAVAGVPVADLTHGELVDLAGYHVPTLDEVAAMTWSVGWNLEIKTVEAYEIARPTLASWRGEVLLSSFIHDVVAKASRDTRHPCGLLVAHRPLPGQMPMPTPGIGTLVWDWKVVDPEVIRQAARAGWRNACYGPVSVHEHTLAREWGIGLTITDHPDRA